MGSAEPVLSTLELDDGLDSELDDNALESKLEGNEPKSELEDMFAAVESPCDESSVGVLPKFTLHPENNITATAAAASAFFFIDNTPFTFALHYCKNTSYFTIIA